MRGSPLSIHIRSLSIHEIEKLKEEYMHCFSKAQPTPVQMADCLEYQDQDLLRRRMERGMKRKVPAKFP
jgi:hypothetical protein